MKALVVSLLRLGDVVMATPTIRALKQKGYSVDLLINKQFENLKPLLIDVNHVHLLDRKAIEKALVEPHRPMFEAYDRLNQLVQTLKKQNYDLVVNVTHNQLSGHLTSLIQGQHTIGLKFNSDSRFNSPWFRYLNDVSQHKESHFHYADLFQFSLGEKKSLGRTFLQETSKGRAEWHEHQKNLSSVFLIQPFSSDTKKQWLVPQLLQTILNLEKKRPELSFVVMGAPFESDALFDLQQKLKALGSRASFVTLSLEGALSAIHGAEFFLTLDTATKHLAAATKTKVLELALGSSEPSKTGFYRDKGFILQSLAECAPCSHVSACEKVSHFCSLSFTPEVVSDIAVAILDQDDDQLKAIANKYSHQFQLSKTVITGQGYWAALNIDSPVLDVEKALLKSALRLSFSVHHEEQHLQMGSACLDFHQGLDQDVSLSTVEQLETRLVLQIDKVKRLKMEFQMQLGEKKSIGKFVGQVQELLKECDLSASHRIEDIKDRNLLSLRRLQMALADVERKSDIQLKLVRNIPAKQEQTL